jgi:HAD superfamily hydrolase (TIGR01493 family)
MADRLAFVFFDIGGVLYDDRIYALAWRRALREAGGAFSDEAFEREYTAIRAAQNGSFRRRLADAFVGPDADLHALKDVAARHWAYPPSALEPDAVPCLERLAPRFRMGIIANQPSAVRAALERDGLIGFFETWAVSDDLGVQKPDPGLFALALETAGVEAGRAAMVGDRLDYDVRPAGHAGMRTVWLLRGEAPDHPTPEQLAEADATVPSLVELPEVLEAWA